MAYHASVEITSDEHGVSQVQLKSPRGASTLVSLHGGHVRSWKNEKGEELLFTSSKAILKPPAAARGGIPICFPLFGNRDSLEQHGFARNRMWAVDANPPPLPPTDSNGKTFIDLLLKPSDDDLKIWPHSYELRLRVALSVDGNLFLISRVRNVNSKPFSFSFAYHTYFSVSDINEVRVEGVETLDYLDNLCNRERFTEQGDALTFEKEVDRVYLCATEPVVVFDHQIKRIFVIKKEGLSDIVVWNPWEKTSGAILDFGNDEYKHMVCVDAAAIDRPITLKPGQEWTVSQVQLQNGHGASVRVSLYGGHVRSWKNNRGEELLFMSRKAIFKPPEAVRGGIPVCFPLFENRDCMETHGFARKRMWEVDANHPPLPSTDSEGRAFIDLLLIASDNDLRFWPHRFELRLRVALDVDGKLFLITRVRNLNLTSKPFSFMFALRTYFSVSDIDEVRVEGADTLHYLDNLLNKERFTEQQLGLTFEEEVDRVYLSTSEPFAVYDHQTKRIVVIKKEGLPDIVVWNPWAKKSKAIPDLGNDEYLRMVCVDPAAMEKPIKLKPGEEWIGRVELSTPASLP